MAELRFPIGIQTFEKIIEQGYTYIDKTGYIPSIIKHGQYVFLSRPRRFGKSLLLSTLKAFFEAKRHLFKDLALDKTDVKWESYPIIHFDFNNGYYNEIEGLIVKIHDSLRDYEEEYGLPVGDPNPNDLPIRFKRLIKAAYEKHKKGVVILIDEYDKPLLSIEKDIAVFEEYQKLLKSFYGNLKTMDAYIRFAFITGVARFSKVSIFSDFNNLDDISMENDFANICGWTEKELLDTFSPAIEELAKESEEDFQTTLEALRVFYDGYLFTPKGSRLYNPFSVLRAFKAKEIDPYWFTTGSPYFLVRRVREMMLFPPEINHQRCTRDELTAVGFNDANPLPLMFQTGYLTIDSYNKDTRIFELRFPNKEVEIGFYKDLLPQYIPEIQESDSPFNFIKFSSDLYEGRPADFMKRLDTLFKGLPGEDHCEAAYRAITYLLTVLCGTQTIAEHHGYLGRSDIEVVTGNYIYIFEFKYNKSVREAMDQIHSRDYAGRFAMDNRQIYLIAANFNEKKGKRGLEYEFMKWSAFAPLTASKTH